MRVKLIKEYNEIPVGSVIKVEKVLKNSYRGIWSSFVGSFIVDVKKEFCEIISDNNNRKI